MLLASIRITNQMTYLFARSRNDRFHCFHFLPHIFLPPGIGDTRIASSRAVGTPALQFAALAQLKSVPLPAVQMVVAPCTWTVQSEKHPSKRAVTGTRK